MIPAWKLKREWQRFKQQLKSIPEAIWEPVAQRRHDAAFPLFPRHEGAIPLRGKVALFLIWQPFGLAESVLETCRHLNAQGYSVLVVANQNLVPDDLDAILRETWQVLIRPNFGYDFGGYRDGLRFLRERAIQPDRLVMMNDSVWYPLYPQDDLLAACEQTGADVTGTVLRHRGRERFLESYFYSFRGSVVQSAAFADYWKNYRLTSNKYKVIRRGERGFSRALQAADFRVEGLYRENDFLTALAAADNVVLASTLAYSAFVDPAQAQAAQALSQQGTHSQMLAFIEAATRKHQFYSTFPVAAQRLMRYPVLKKSHEPVSLFWRKQWVRAVLDGEIPRPIENVLGEAKSTTSLCAEL